MKTIDSLLARYSRQADRCLQAQINNGHRGKNGYAWYIIAREQVFRIFYSHNEAINAQHDAEA